MSSSDNDSDCGSDDDLLIDLSVADALSTVCGSYADSKRVSVFVPSAPAIGSSLADIGRVYARVESVFVVSGSAVESFRLFGRRFTALRHIDIAASHVADLTGADALIAVERIDAADNCIDDVSPLSECPRLIRLDVRRNLLADFDTLSFLAHCRGLTSIALTGNRIAADAEFNSRMRSILPRVRVVADVVPPIRLSVVSSAPFFTPNTTSRPLTARTINHIAETDNEYSAANTSRLSTASTSISFVDATERGSELTYGHAIALCGNISRALRSRRKCNVNQTLT